MGLTEEEKNLAMVIAGKVSGAISIISSTFIVRDIYTKWKAKRRSDHLPPTTLLVLSMSLGDIGSSFFAFFLGSWMVPTEGDFPLAAGTDATCDAQAFLFGVFFGSSNMTNGIMALVYWLVICREKPEKDLRAWYWQALMFGYPWLWGIVYAARKLLWFGIAMGYHIVPSLGLGAEKAETDVMRKPPRKRTERLLTRNLLGMSYGVVGMTQALSGFTSYFVVLFKGGWTWGEDMRMIRGEL